MSIRSAATVGLKSLTGGLNAPPAVIWVPAIFVGAILLLPLIYLVVRSLDSGGDLFDLLLRERVGLILGRTILLVGTVTLSSIAIALPLAWLTTRTNLPFRRVWVVLSALPLVIPSYVAGFIVIAALGPRGMLYKALDGPLDIDSLPDIHGFPGAFLTLTFLSFPYVVLTVRAAMLRIDPAMEESSRGLGHGGWRTFFFVTLPLLRPGIAAGGLLVALYTLSDFGAVSLLHYETFTWAIFVQYDSALDRTLGAGLSLVLVVFAFAVIGLEFVGRGRARFYSSSSSAIRPPTVVALGLWKWPAVAFCTSIISVSLVAPMSVLGYWVARGISAGEPFNLVWESIGNSIYIAALAATVAVIAATPVAALTVRYPGLLSGFLEKLSYIGFALPGIAIALALVFFGARYALPLYQTTGLLLLAYVVLFVSPALGTLRTSMLQVSPRLEEAARGLGKSPIRAFSSVTLPIVRPGLLAGCAPGS